MKTLITRAINDYQMLVDFCEEEIKKDSTTAVLEGYLKGKKEAYLRIIDDLKKLDNYAETH
ncbi:MAG: hypothetical protein WC401_10245 [Bacteroidales bacterium]|jgi:hypothetical protein